MVESAWRKAVVAAGKQYAYIIFGEAPLEQQLETSRVCADSIVTVFLASARESGADIPKIEGEP